MKYLEYPELSHLSRTLTHESGECTVHTRIEAYSCKSVRHEKRLFKALEHTYAEDAALASSHSPPGSGPDVTAFGPMDKHSSRKTLYLLIATLNASFPDRDFAGTQAHHFRREENGNHVLSALSTTLAQRTSSHGDAAARSYSSYPPSDSLSASPTTTTLFRTGSPLGRPTGAAVHPALFKMMDEIIGVADCEVYSFQPDGDDDPHAGDTDSDLSSEEDDDAGPGSDDDDDDDNDEHAPFAFEDEAEDPMSSPRRPGAPARSSSRTSADWSPLAVPRAHRGNPQSRTRARSSVLWSSHWFFHNPKMKRVLFITVWARSTGSRRTSSWLDLDTAESFVGWTGANGAGARALALGMKRPASLST
ncbi:Maf1-domain-containing protein [Auriculariales sp. MPI-PUGE-AT-0066]|nr:Maf1-domain-containing protein [Auriculariales sp. MPI-PUGE-AT-0066]